MREKIWHKLWRTSIFWMSAFKICQHQRAEVNHLGLNADVGLAPQADAAVDLGGGTHNLLLDQRSLKTN